MPFSRNLSLDLSSSNPVGAPARVQTSTDRCLLKLRRPGIFGWLGLLLLSMATQGALCPLHAESAHGYYKDGKKAEIREDYITAYQDYRKA